jgi:hypothetical protein
MSLLITFLIWLAVFCVAAWVISVIPFERAPAPVPNLRWVAYVVLGVFAIVVLLGYIPGFHWPS